MAGLLSFAGPLAPSAADALATADAVKAIHPRHVPAAGAAVDRFPHPVVSPDAVVATAAGQHVAVPAAVQPVRTGSATQEVAAGASAEAVVARTAAKAIVARSPYKAVVTAPTVEPIGALASQDAITEAAAAEHV
jgi:hypothetical protein